MRAATNRSTSNQRDHAAGTGSDRGLARAPPRSDLVEGVRSSPHAARRAEVRGLKASAHTHARSFSVRGYASVAGLSTHSWILCD